MDRFVSNFTTRLDAKGRVSIPAPFRAVLARDGFEGLYVHPSLDWRAIDCGGNALLASFNAMIDGLPASGLDRDATAMALLGESDVLKIDTEGRVGLTEALREHGGIRAEVSFVGIGHKFQMWEPARFRDQLADARKQIIARRRGNSSDGRIAGDGT